MCSSGYQGLATQTLPVSAARDTPLPGGHGGAQGSLLPRPGHPDRAGRARSGAGAALRAHLPEARAESGAGRRAGRGRASSRRSAGGDPEPGRDRRAQRTPGRPLTGSSARPRTARTGPGPQPRDKAGPGPAEPRAGRAGGARTAGPGRAVPPGRPRGASGLRHPRRPGAGGEAGARAAT